MEILELLSIPAIIVTVEAIKMTGYVSHRFIPLVAILVGAIIGIIMGDVITGIILGVTSSGVFSQIKTASGK
jgi:mannose/fructose/N-acetylgalactosamine-specific phosphotransferase system component IIC